MRFHPRRLQGEALELRQLMAVNVLEGAEPANSSVASAVVFTFPADDSTAVLKGSANKDDKDFFAFTAPANGTLSATLLQTRATLEIEDAGSREILELEPKDGVTAGTVQLSAGERYTVRLRGTEKAVTQYEATLIFTPSGETTTPPTGGNNGGQVGDDHGGHGNEPGDDNGPNGGVVSPPTTEDPTATVVAESEPNNARFTATQFSLVGSTRLEGAASKEDRDFFAFTVPTNGNFTVGVRSAGTKVQVEIEDQSGREVLELEPRDGISSGTVALVSGRTYFLRVKADDATAVAYKVDLQPATIGAPIDAPPAAATPATALASKFDTSGDDSISPLDALLIINHLNARHDDHPSARDLSEIAFDVDDDGAVVPLDVLRVINYLNSQSASPKAHDAGDDHGVDVLAETEQHNGADEVTATADAYYAQLELEHEQETEQHGLERESRWEGIDG